MSKLLNSNKFWIALILIAALIVAGISIRRSKGTKLLDKEAYSSFRTALNEVFESEAGGFESQEELRTFIENWADENSLKYREDKYGNIIFNKPAIKRKRNVTPTLIGVSMNYETAADNIQILASAAAIALSDIESGRRTVVFFDVTED